MFCILVKRTFFLVKRILYICKQKTRCRRNLTDLRGPIKQRSAELASSASRGMRASTARSIACFAALILATSGRAETPYMPLTCCGFDTAMMLERLFKCKVGEEGKPWSKYCANGEAQHCAHYIKLQKDGAHFCCERCRLRSLGEWDNNPPPVSDEPVAHHAIRVDADGYSTGS